MVSDGVLEAMPGEQKEEAMKAFLENLGEKHPQEMADRILEFALSLEAAADDMTVLVGGIFER